MNKMRFDWRSLAVFAVPLLFAVGLILWPVPLSRLAPGAKVNQIMMVTENGRLQERTLLPDADSADLNALLAGVCGIRSPWRDQKSSYDPGDLLVLYGDELLVLTQTDGYVYQPEHPTDRYIYGIIGRPDALYARVSALLEPSS